MSFTFVSILYCYYTNDNEITNVLTVHTTGRAILWHCYVYIDVVEL